MDKIDYKKELNPVTCKASEVLKYKTGYCYAKSHGLNAVYLPDIGWYRLDARGNKDGIEAKFTPPIEKLAFSILFEGEADVTSFPEIWSAPLPEVIRVLANSFQEVAENLPDVEITKSLQ